MNAQSKHFITIVSPTGDSVTVDIALNNEQYHLVNRICALFASEASITQPILVISQPTEDIEERGDETED